MASIRKQQSTYEIRECRSTELGPRQYTLATFKKVLTPEVLEEAAGRAQRPFDPQALIAAARARGIPVTHQRSWASARRLLRELRGGRILEPSLVALLKRALAAMEERPLPPHLAAAADWLAQSEASRGKALRGLLRAASRVAHSRAPRRERPAEPFPRFSSGKPAFPAS